uniref:Phosphodiesterase n=1 Tax=Chromera velia CCMP2878 TaxID=1169474 RepID=A0A0G4HX23_9ALVE|eukprot:Cvel_9186.t1-p1 / transcript=Cvel_9186.t1 / gene=Cvel_9186 / organism=Chromera_velia_CCMP2878 / gene_product=cAMP-specific 3',5'-cyclic phosphodiesterase 4C, putative / transcript_product=cAMP-specific 3',5'-cyclic phosphodiesterase 4C, putative / location=Cvel_scaffold523:58101-68347(+) / protein_length=1083 / sequence_SO=supercontig / SO=protein_coding / is_pseudo=false
MWAYTYFKEETKCPTIKTHIISNNTFTKLVFDEYYLAPEYRCNFFFRLTRWLIAMCFLFIAVSFLLNQKDRDYHSICQRRSFCKDACITDHFPRLTCGDSAYQLRYGGNYYGNLYRYYFSTSYSWQRCADYVNKNQEEETNTLFTGRVPRVHTCFEGCRRRDGNGMKIGGIVEDLNYDWQYDNRPNCTADMADGDQFLLCVDPDDTCEKTRFAGETCFSASYTQCVPFALVIYSVLIAAPCIFLSDLLFLVTNLIYLEDLNNCCLATLKCGLQWLELIIALGAFLAVAIQIMAFLTFGRPEVLAISYAFAILFDQVRNLVFQFFIWFALMRKGGLVPVMDEKAEFSFEDDDKEAGIQWRRVLQEVVSSFYFDAVVYSLVGLYAVFVMIQLALGDEQIDQVPGLERVFVYFDLTLLCLFLLEIIIRFVAFGLAYLMDLWNLFDAAVVLVSFVFAIVGQTSGGQPQNTQGLFILRLLRLLRLVLVLRKATKSNKRQRPPGSGIVLTSPVERVLQSLREIKDLEVRGWVGGWMGGWKLSQRDKDNVDWVMDVISSNKLYSVEITKDKAKDPSDMDIEIQTWLRLASEQLKAGEDVQDKELETLLIGKSKKAQQQQQQQQAQDKTSQKNTKAVLSMNALSTSPKDTTQGGDGHDEEADVQFEFHADLFTKYREEGFHRLGPAKVVEGLALLEEMGDEWEFDVWELYGEVGGEYTLAFAGMHCAAVEDLLKVFEIPSQVLCDFFMALSKGYVSTNPYHNSVHAADVVQSFHVLRKWASAKHPQIFGAQETLAGLMAAAVHDFEHPGFNNTLLIQIQHPIAVRYNDISPLENHHVAAAFALMMKEGRRDPLETLSEEQYVSIRRTMIKMVLATDNASHASQMSMFKTKMTRQDFPSLKQLEDKQLLLNMLLHAADISNPAKPLQMYLEWVPRVMEEFWRQGDVEKSKHLTVTPFYDRDNCVIAKCQAGFVEVLCHPLFEALTTFLGPDSSVLMTHIEVVRAHWRAELKGQGNEDAVLKADRGQAGGANGGRKSVFAFLFGKKKDQSAVAVAQAGKDKADSSPLGTPPKKERHHGGTPPRDEEKKTSGKK